MTWRDLSRVLLWSAIGIAAMAMLSYATGIDALKDWGAHPMAIPTALALLFTAAAILMRDRDK